MKIRKCIDLLRVPTFDKMVENCCHGSDGVKTLCHACEPSTSAKKPS